ncbi:chemotaxis protein CheW [Microcoleus sp. FACHB-53]|nr:chemotaxis protein CheW [Microcoleus sp. FACHB-53]
METKQYLIFRLHDVQYGIEAELVHEILSLPELIPLTEASNNIIGMLNLRGQIVPIMHLDLLQEPSLKECKISDYLIMGQWEELQFGLVAHQTHELLEIDAELIQKQPPEGILNNINAPGIAGFATVNEEQILLLEPKTLMPQPDTILPLIWDAQSQLDLMTESLTSDVEKQLEPDGAQQAEEFLTPKNYLSFYDLYCPRATPQERETFRARAENLKPQIESSTLTNELTTLAVINLGDEYFGLDLELIREFTDIGNLTPIPCCPNHIIGNMNLRGEIITLVDIRNVLNLPTAPVRVGSPTVVVEVNDIVAGLPVDQVLEMAYLNSADITPLSGILPDLAEQYMRGSAFFQEKKLKVLDLPKIFTQGGLVVNEEA